MPETEPLGDIKELYDTVKRDIRTIDAILDDSEACGDCYMSFLELRVSCQRLQFDIWRELYAPRSVPALPATEIR